MQCGLDPLLQQVLCKAKQSALLLVWSHYAVVAMATVKRKVKAV